MNKILPPALISAGGSSAPRVSGGLRVRRRYYRFNDNLDLAIAYELLSYFKDFQGHPPD